MSTKKFPQFVYVKIEKDGETTYLVADEDHACLVEKDGDNVRVARYKLVSTGTVVTNRAHYVED